MLVCSGTSRKIEKMGPFSMFQRLVREWTRDKGMTPREVATKVKVKFTYQSYEMQHADYTCGSVSSITTL